jgi:hypothetical protein
MINVNRLTINISDAEIISNSKAINKEEIYRKEYISISEKLLEATRICSAKMREATLRTCNLANLLRIT